MYKKFLRVNVVFITLFYFCLNSVQAYEFQNTKNESGVLSTIDSIYESKELYEALFEDEEGTLNRISSDLMWWPIGSDETVTYGGDVFALGEPRTLNTSDGFGCFEWRADKEKGEICGWHYGLDMGDGSAPGIVNIIAVKDGEVVYPTEDYQTQYKDHSGNEYGNGDGGGLGNYVVIKHSDGTYSYYGHMAQNSITVRAGKYVRQGQVIGKMGHTGSSTAPHLHFAVRVGGTGRENCVDPLDYIDPENPRPQGSNSNFSLYNTVLTKAEFTAKMNNYCVRSGSDGFCNNFAKQAETIYDTSLNNGVNPELVVVEAGVETKWSLDSTCAYTNNYWGIGIESEGACNSGGKYDSLLDGVADYARVVNEYNPGGKYSDRIISRYKERSKADCDSAGHGVPGTIEGMQSLYPTFEYRYNPGDSEIGGCYFLKQVYGASTYCNVKTSCTGYTDDRTEDSKICSVESKTTVCEQNDYTAWQLKEKNQIRYEIFGL